ncbi:MAG: DUF4410 domain-containing protein [Acidobacteria bacterium]|nr:MAG: DUF4410 domain-containing protein [Acidobacteriota bacterium]TDI42099.1 MAG: DUF4410 domain-containing protein [Acidobacteriota bacterium]
MKMTLSTLVLAFLVLGGQLRAERAPIEIDDGILDWIRISEPRIPADAAIIIHLFDASKADLGTGSRSSKEKHFQEARTMQEEAPPLFASELIDAIKKIGPFQNVSPAVDVATPPENALIIEGRFTVLDPGSRAKRYWGGFGAGKGVWVIRGTVKDVSGNLLAEFEQKRITVMGAFGGNPVKKLRADCERLGEDVALFLNAWATGNLSDKD